ncbi:MAG: DJ-1/PfpI family protein [Ktedonobacteraceae bacterium]|nr:DJ-1/PfpI family protein [Ktedonobacteraceae bacterium]
MKRVVRIALFSLAFLLPIFLIGGVGFLSSSQVVTPPVPRSQMVARPELPSPQYDPNRPTVVVLLGNDFTEVTDFLSPYALFAETHAFNVFAVAPTHQVTTLTGGLDIVPDFSLSEFDARIGKDPDVIVVPNIPNIERQENRPLLTWMKKHAGANTILLSWCTGANTLALTGLLDGKAATSHWAYLAQMERSYPQINWKYGVRYVDNGSTVTSAGLTSGFDATLHVISRLKGEQMARNVAAAFHYPSVRYMNEPQAPQYSITLSDGIYILNGAYNWQKPSQGVLLYEGVGEIELASLFDIYAGTFFSQMLAVAPTRQVITSQYGLHLIPRYSFNDLPDVARLLVPGRDARGQTGGIVAAWKQTHAAPATYVHAESSALFAYVAPIEDLAQQQNVPIANFFLRRLEYREPLQLTGPGWPLLLFVEPLLIGGISLGFVIWLDRWLTARRKLHEQGKQNIREAGHSDREHKEQYAS